MVCVCLLTSVHLAKSTFNVLSYIKAQNGAWDMGKLRGKEGGDIVGNITSRPRMSFLQPIVFTL